MQCNSVPESPIPSVVPYHIIHPTLSPLLSHPIHLPKLRLPLHILNILKLLAHFHDRVSNQSRIQTHRPP